MNLHFVTVRTADQVELDGALYLPDGSPAEWGIPIFAVHGLTWNFYRGPVRWLPPLLVEAGYPCLSLNMRDHDLDQPKDFALSHHDLRAGIEHLIGRFRKTPVLLGHGYANNKLASYAAQSGDDRIEAYVLTTLGSVQKYRPDIWESVLGNARRMRGHALVVQGAIDELIEARPRANELTAAASACRIDVHLLAGGNHYFHGREAELASVILGWLAQRAKASEAR